MKNQSSLHLDSRQHSPAGHFHNINHLCQFKDEWSLGFDHESIQVGPKLVIVQLCDSHVANWDGWRVVIHMQKKYGTVMQHLRGGKRRGMITSFHIRNKNSVWYGGWSDYWLLGLNAAEAPSQIFLEQSSCSYTDMPTDLVVPPGDCVPSLYIYLIRGRFRVPQRVVRSWLLSCWKRKRSPVFLVSGIFPNLDSFNWTLVIRHFICLQI